MKLQKHVKVGDHVKGRIATTETNEGLQYVMSKKAIGIMLDTNRTPYRQIIADLARTPMERPSAMTCRSPRSQEGRDESSNVVCDWLDKYDAQEFIAPDGKFGANTSLFILKDEHRQGKQ